MPTVTENVDLPGGVDPTAVIVSIQLVGAAGDPLREVYDQTAGRTIAGFYQFPLSTSGTWSLSMTANDSLTPTGSVYRRTLTGRRVPTTFEYGEVPTTGGPYRWDEILTDAPASITSSALAVHAADEDLHGGGQELGYAALGTNFATSSTSYVNITGMALTLTTPSRPFVLEAWMPILIEESGRSADVRLVHSGSTVITADTVRSVVASQFTSLFLRARIPASTHAPATGSAFTYQVQMQSSSTTNDVTIFVSFGGPVNVAYLQAYTL